MLRQKIILPVLAAAMVGGGLVGVGLVSAQDTDPSQSLVEKLAQKLGVDESKVKQAFEQIKTERKSQMQQNYAQFLDQAVKEGKITEAQKQLILNKHNEVMTQRQVKKQELQDWAKQNNIDIKYLFGSRMGGHKMWMSKPSASPQI